MQLLLAPMEGLLDFALRDTLTRVNAGAALDPAAGLHPSGIDRCVSEFIRITDTLLPPRSFTRTMPELLTGGRTLSGVPVRGQLLGSDPTLLAENAARLAELGSHGVDLNFGCPANVVNRHGGGSALLQEPELIHRIVAATDPGYAVNPQQIEAQVEGSFVYGLSAALFGECTVKDGAIEQKNFDTYPVLKMAGMPKVETIVMGSGGFWGGVGEPAQAPLAPALVNAISAAMGKRIRSLPLKNHGLSLAKA